MTPNQIAYWTLQENVRAHKADEAERNRANLAAEAERQRANMAQEALSERNIVEAQRHNLAQEQFNVSQLNEAARSNLMNESIKASQVAVQEMNAITQQKESVTKARAQGTNEQRLQWDKDFGTANTGIKAVDSIANLVIKMLK